MDVYLHDAQEHDQKAPVQLASIPAHAIRLCDLGYYKLDVLEQLDVEGSLWVTRYKTGTALCDLNGERLAILKMLPKKSKAPIDIPILLGSKHQLPCRLIAQRISKKQLKQRRKQLEQWEAKHQRKASPLKWEMIKWSIYITNATTEQLSVVEVMLMARVRWQIELLFKLWKDIIDIDDWRSEHPWRILCEVYAKLTACIIQHWLMLVGGIHALDRSMTQATPVIQHWAWALAHVLTHKSILIHFIRHIGQILASSCRISTSTSSLPTFQRIEQQIA